MIDIRRAASVRQHRAHALTHKQRSAFVCLIPYIHLLSAWPGRAAVYMTEAFLTVKCQMHMCTHTQTNQNDMEHTATVIVRSQ